MGFQRVLGMDQIALFNDRRTIQERFEEYDRLHPEVFAYMLTVALRVKTKGFRKFSIRTIWEQMRWYFQIEKDEGAEFKLNDHFHSRYARKLMAEYPEFEGFFEIRELRS